MKSNSVCNHTSVLLQIELDDTKFCYQLIITLPKFVIYKALFLKKSKHKKFQHLFLPAVKKGHLSEHMMARTIQLLRHDAYCSITVSCPIKAEIRAVDSQPDLRILL